MTRGPEDFYARMASEKLIDILTYMMRRAQSLEWEVRELKDKLEELEERKDGT